MGAIQRCTSAGLRFAALAQRWMGAGFHFPAPDGRWMGAGYVPIQRWIALPALETQNQRWNDAGMSLKTQNPALERRWNGAGFGGQKLVECIGITIFTKFSENI